MTSPTSSPKCILSFSGSFNPIHLGHIQLLNLIKEHLENELGYQVVKGYIAPSSDQYVQGKLGDEAISLTHRLKLAELAIEDSTWLETCPFGIMSSAMTASQIRKVNFIPKSTKIFEIGGADYALRARPWTNSNKPFICVGRNTYTNKVKNLSSKFKNDNFILLETEVDDISSTLIRSHLKANSNETNENKEAIIKLVGDKVYNYMIEHFILSD